MFNADVTENGVRPMQKAVGTLVSRINYLRMNILPDGTLGKSTVKFGVPKNFQLPLTVNRDFINTIMTRPKVKNYSYFS
ncbi:MAG TPA: hypothetical protein PKD85_15485 [Saprospiraceae bacterium]|nr:hypothetical protein [Saprospiraceae bacterium]